MSEQEWMKELLQANDEEDVKISAKQAKIIEAAIELFAEKGYAASSTSEIAKKAGVAEGTIFRHYKTKKELLLSIVTPMLVKIVVPFAKVFIREVLDNKHNSYEDFVRLLIHNRFEFVKKNKPIIRILIQEIAFQDELRAQFLTLFTDLAYKKLTAVIIHFQEKGEIITLPAQSVIRMTVTTIAGHLFTRFFLFADQDWDDEEEIERTVQFIMYGLSRK